MKCWKEKRNATLFYFGGFLLLGDDLSRWRHGDGDEMPVIPLPSSIGLRDYWAAKMLLMCGDRIRGGFLLFTKLACVCVYMCVCSFLTRVRMTIWGWVSGGTHQDVPLICSQGITSKSAWGGEDGRLGVMELVKTLGGSVSKRTTDWRCFFVQENGNDEFVGVGTGVSGDAGGVCGDFTRMLVG